MQYFLWNQCHIFVSFRTAQLKLIETICQSLNIYNFPKFQCHIFGPSKVTRCSIFNYFLNTCWTKNATELVRTISRSLFEDTTIIIKEWMAVTTFAKERNTVFWKKFLPAIKHSNLQGEKVFFETTISNYSLFLWAVVSLRFLYICQ